MNQVFIVTSEMYQFHELPTIEKVFDNLAEAKKYRLKRWREVKKKYGRADVQLIEITSWDVHVKNDIAEPYLDES